MRDVVAEETGSSGRGGDQSEDAPDRRRLAGSVGTEEPEHAALGDLEVQPVERDRRRLAQPPVLLAEPLDLDHGCHRVDRTRVPEPGTEPPLAVATVRRTPTQGGGAPVDPNHEILFEPVRIGPKTLRNRFYQVPHCSGFGTEKPWTQAAHRGVKAEGGWAAVCTEYAPFSPESDEAPLIAARFWDEDDMRALRLMTDAAHEHGALAGLELYHGRRAHREQPDEASLRRRRASSRATSNRTWSPRRWSSRTSRGCSASGRRARSAGGTADSTSSTCTAPTRTCRCSSSRPSTTSGPTGTEEPLKDRARFWLETLDAVRDAVGADCAIATRIAVDALGPAGIHVEEALEFVNLADDLVDLWDVNVGSIAYWSKDSGTSRYFAEGYQLEWTGGIRQATAKPIVGVGRLTSPDRMASIVRSGVWDLVGAARPSIADPFLPQEDRGGPHRRDPRVHGFERLHHEGRRVRTPRLHPERDGRRGTPPRVAPGALRASVQRREGRPRRGCRAPRVWSARSRSAGAGSRPCTWSRPSDDIGGRMRWVRRLPTLGDWGRIVDHRKVMLSKLRNVEVITGRRLSAEDVRDYGAQLVVVATGSHWSGEGLQSSTHEPIEGASASLPHVLTPEQVMEGKRPPGGRVVVYDAEGYFVGPGIAELLANEGLEVHLVTSLEVVSPISDLTLEGPMLRQHLHEQGVTAHRGVTVLAVEPGRVSGEDEFEEPWSLEADGIVLVTQQVSDDALYRELVGDPAGLAASGIEAVYRIGDCVAPRMISEAIFDGHRLAREIDGDDPSDRASVRPRTERARRRALRDEMMVTHGHEAARHGSARRRPIHRAGGRLGARTGPRVTRRPPPT